jgi:hypothetical protein
MPANDEASGGDTSSVGTLSVSQPSASSPGVS